jgi:hypothetical protein
MALSAQDIAAIKQEARPASSTVDTRPASPAADTRKAAPAKPAESAEPVAPSAPSGLTTEELTDIRLNASSRSGAPASTASVTETGAGPTPADIQRELKTGFVQGLTRGSIQSASAFTGLRAGAMGAPFAGPVGPYLPGIGFVGGLTLGNMLADDVDKKFPGVPMQSLIPYREGAKIAGESIMYAPGIFMLPQLQGGRVAQFVTDLGTSARKNPATFLLGEGISAVGAGTGGGLAEQVFPGNSFARLTGEVGGSVFMPGKFFVTALNVVGDLAVRMKNAVLPGKGKEAAILNARELEAANKLREILETNKEDVGQLIKALEAQLPGGVSPTAAQKTGSASLMMFENTMARGNPVLAATVKAKGTDTLKAYALLVENLRQIGSRDALKKAAEIESSVFTDMLNERIMAAELVAADRINKIKVDRPETRKMVGSIVKESVVKALDDSRNYEQLLWNEAIKDSVKIRKVKGETIVTPRAAPVTNLGESFLEVATSMTPERFNAKVPAEIRAIMSRLGIDSDAIANYAKGKNTPEYLNTGRVPSEYLTKPAGPRTDRRVSIFEGTTVQDLINIRGDLLSYARDSAVSNPSFANFYGRLSEAALRDLDALPGTAYDRARSFSRALNDVFSRTLASDVTQGTAIVGGKVVPTTVGEKLPAEILVQRAYGSANDLTSLRMDQIENAVGFLKKQYDDAVRDFGPNSSQARALQTYADVSEKAAVSVRDAHGKVLLAAANKTIKPVLDPSTGITRDRVDARALQQFVAENKPMLDRMGLTKDLSSAVTAENAFRLVLDKNSAFNKSIQSQKAFADAVATGVESPTRLITQVLNGDKPIEGFSKLVNIAAKSKSLDAMAGLKASVMDYAFTKAGGVDGFSPQAFQSALFEPLGGIKGQPSLYGLMRNKNIITLNEGKQLKQVLNRMSSVEEAIGNGRLLEELVAAGGPIEELALRIMGSKLGQAFDSNSLIAASAGSKYLRDMFDKTPMMAVKNMLERAVVDPQFAAELLKKTGTLPREKMYLAARMFNSSLINAGVNYATSDERPTIEPTLPPYAAPLPPLRQRRLQPQTAPTRGVPGLSEPAMPSNVPAMPDITSSPLPAPAKAPSQGQGTGREMLRRLFPFDTTIQ